MSKVEAFIQSPLAFAIAGGCALLAVIISLRNVCCHFRNFTKPSLQIYTVRILVIVPFYAVTSFFSLLYPSYAVFLDTFRDCYEAFVIYCFLTLMIQLGGGEAHTEQELAIEPGFIRHPWPLCKLPVVPLSGLFIRRCKQGTLQFVVVKPLMAVLSLLMFQLGRLDDKAYQIFLLVVYNTSYTIALYVLVLFYMATKTLLKQYHPVQKFLAVKAVVFMPYWQGLLLVILPGIDRKVDLVLNDFILCVEMLIFAFLHSKAFSFKEFRGGIPDTSALQGVGEVLSIRDVALDTYHNFMPTYQDYTLQRADDDLRNSPSRTFRARTFILDCDDSDNDGDDDDRHRDGRERHGDGSTCPEEGDKSSEDTAQAVEPLSLPLSALVVDGEQGVGGAAVKGEGLETDNDPTEQTRKTQESGRGPGQEKREVEGKDDTPVKKPKRWMFRKKRRGYASLNVGGDSDESVEAELTDEGNDSGDIAAIPPPKSSLSDDEHETTAISAR